MSKSGGGHKPFFKFYRADWLGDPKLRMCSLAARGLWTDMLVIMHDADPCGYLTVGGQSVAPEDLALLVGRPLEEVTAALAELESREVFSRNRAGIIYSRKMIRDDKKARDGAKFGKMGGNPSLRKQRQNSETLNGPDKANNGGLGINLESRVQSPESKDSPPSPPQSKDQNWQRVSDDLKREIGVSFDDPRWYGLGYIVQVWLREGFTAPELVEAVRSIMLGRHGVPPDTPKYFERAVPNAVAEIRRRAAAARPRPFTPSTNDNGLSPWARVTEALLRIDRDLAMRIRDAHVARDYPERDRLVAEAKRTYAAQLGELAA